MHPPDGTTDLIIVAADYRCRIPWDFTAYECLRLYLSRSPGIRVVATGLDVNIARVCVYTTATARVAFTSGYSVCSSPLSPAFE